jgi:RNA polymerase sigma factor (sigma-70 family)
VSTSDPFQSAEQLIRRVYAYVAYRIGDGPEAEDVTSAAFERALRYRDSFDPVRGDAASWLVGIARRCIADSVDSRLETTEEIPDVEAPGDLEADTVRRLALGHLVVATLDERARELVALRYGADMTARQIGQVLGLKTNAVEVALSRALECLRARLEPPTGEEQARARPEFEWASGPHR